MRRFILRANIERYQRLLESEADAERRRLLRELLLEEEKKLTELTAPDP